MILKQSGNSVTILAQFNPEKFKETTESLSSQSEASTTCSTPINKTKQSHEGSSSTPPIRRNNGILPIIDNEPPGDLRYVFFTKSPSSLGFNIAGGNAMGIFVSEMQPDDEAVSSSGLSVGDHILEVNELARYFLSETIWGGGEEEGEGREGEFTRLCVFVQVKRLLLCQQHTCNRLVNTTKNLLLALINLHIRCSEA